MRKFYEVSKKALLLIAGIIWAIAGFNVLRLGIISYNEIVVKWFYYLFSALVFSAFGMMFYKMSQTHTRRILGYEETYKPFWNFFDVKSYIIMVIMMSGGIGLRAVGVFPPVFVAWFYTGLGLALFLAGVVFIVNYIKVTK